MNMNDKKHVIYGVFLTAVIMCILSCIAAIIVKEMGVNLYLHENVWYSLADLNNAYDRYVRTLDTIKWFVGISGISVAVSGLICGSLESRTNEEVEA